MPSDIEVDLLQIAAEDIVPTVQQPFAVRSNPSNPDGSVYTTTITAKGNINTCPYTTFRWPSFSQEDVRTVGIR